MQGRKWAIVPAILLMATSVAQAQDDRPPRERGDRGPGPRGGVARLLEQFDKDGDGQLNQEERAAAREEMRRQREANRADRPSRDQPRGDRAEDRRAPRQTDRARGEARQGKSPRGEARDGQRRRGGPREADRRESDRRDGDARQRGDRQRGERPRVERQRDDRQREARERGPRESGARDRGPRGDRQARRGSQGRPPFGPNRSAALFDRFDRNNDGQLSRREFEAMSRSFRNAMSRGFGQQGPMARFAPRGERFQGWQRPGWQRDSDRPSHDVQRRDRDQSGPRDRQAGPREGRGRGPADRAAEGRRGPREGRGPAWDRSGRPGDGSRRDRQRPRADKAEEVVTPSSPEAEVI